MDNFLFGAVLGVCVVLCIICVKVAFTVSEMLSILKTVYVELNKIQQVTNATLATSEQFVDAINVAAQDFEARRSGNVRFVNAEDAEDFLNKMRELRDQSPDIDSLDELTESEKEKFRKMFESESDDDPDANNEPWKKK